MSQITLYELTNQYQALEALIDSEELPDEFVRDTLEGIEGDFDEKCKNVAYVILHLQAMSKAIAEAAAAALERSRRVAARAERLKAYMLFAMQVIDRKKIELPEMVIRRQTNPPSVVILSHAVVPPEFWYQPEPPPPAIARKKLKEAIENGATIEGVYIDSGEHLRIVL